MNYSDDILTILLQDKTTGKNIIWAIGEHAGKSITLEDIPLIQPRFQKNFAALKNRTRQTAEIFTPAWICDFQNNVLDVELQKLSWQDYIDAKCLEIACGEAPYLVNRYDAVTGNEISLDKRIGLLDRKFRVVDKFTHDDNEWVNIWSYRALKSIYGFDLQGDNVFLARKNILDTYADYFYNRRGYDPSDIYLNPAADIISWNIFQMDAKTYAVPFNKNLLCKITDWQENEIVTFKSIGDAEDVQVTLQL